MEPFLLKKKRRKCPRTRRFVSNVKAKQRSKIGTVTQVHTVYIYLFPSNSSLPKFFFCCNNFKFKSVFENYLILLILLLRISKWIKLLNLTKMATDDKLFNNRLFIYRRRIRSRVLVMRRLWKEISNFVGNWAIQVLIALMHVINPSISLHSLAHLKVVVNV